MGARFLCGLPVVVHERRSIDRDTAPKLGRSKGMNTRFRQIARPGMKMQYSKYNVSRSANLHSPRLDYNKEIKDQAARIPTRGCRVH